MKKHKLKFLFSFIFIQLLFSCYNSNLKLHELSKIEFNNTFTKEMINVTENDEKIVDIWKYVKLLENQKLIPETVYNRKTVKYIYRNNESTFDHVILPTSSENMFVIIVINIKQKKIQGHFKLNLLDEYSLKSGE